jgi:hypothetical protein
VASGKSDNLIGETMGKVNAMYLEHEEHSDVLIEAFQSWLDKLSQMQAATGKTINQYILTNVLENNIDIENARWIVFFNLFVEEFLPSYVDNYSIENKVDLNSHALWQANEQYQHGLYGQFECYLKEL